MKNNVSEWPETTKTQRLLDCRTMLLVHGAMTDAEGIKVLRRITAIDVRERKKGACHEIPARKNNDLKR